MNGSGASRAAQDGSSWGWGRELLFVVVVALVISTLLRAFVVQVFWIPSPSMRDTLRESDRIAVVRGPHYTGDIRRGDVVVFDDQLGWLPTVRAEGVAGVARRVGEFVGLVPAGGEQVLVKRVIGVGGDRVRCCTADGRISVNGQPIAETYVASGQSPSSADFDVTVPQGRLWVMGDNRGESADSRLHMGAGQSPYVSTSAVVGRAQWVIWPVSHWSSIDGRTAFARVPDAR